MNTPGRSIVALLLLVTLREAGAQAADAAGRRLAIAEAMSNMMDAMGMFGQGAGSAPSGSGSGLGQFWDSFSSGGGGPSWAPPWSPRDWGTAMPGQMMRWWQQRGPDGPPAMPGSGRLDGIWVSNTGERLWLRGDRFRLQSGPDRFADGVLEVRGDLLSLRAPRLNASWVYEFAEDQGRLALRDTEGRIFLYRRVDPRELWLGGPGH